MKRALLTLLAGGGFVAAGILPGPAVSQTYPDPGRPIIIVNPYPPGALGDILARQMAPKLTESLGVPVHVENKPGANGSIGTGEVARSKPDGHTVALVPMSTLTINPWLYKDLPYDPSRLSPVSMALTLPNALVVHPSVPAANLAEFVDYARKSSSQINFASQGNGSSGHLMGELFKMHVNSPMLTHVPYKGGTQAHTDLLAGNVQMMFDNVGVVLPHIKAGKLKGLAVSTLETSPQAPDLPPIASVIPGFDATIWFGFVGPEGIPTAVLQKMNEHFVRAMRAPDIVSGMEGRGVTVVGSSRDELARRIRTDLERWGKVVKEAKITMQ